jgi:uncharacterized protein Smg (DUF494 family)
MFIGLTYDLKSEYLKKGFLPDEVAEFDSEETIEGIESALHKLGHKTERIGNILQLADALVNISRPEVKRGLVRSETTCVIFYKKQTLVKRCHSACSIYYSSV